MKTLLLVSALLAVGCTSPSGPFGGPDVVASVKEARVEISNQSSNKIFYLVVGQEAAAYSDWMPCVTDSCASILPGATASVSIPRVGIPASEKKASVYWWRAVSDGVGLKADTVHRFTVQLK